MVELWLNSRRVTLPFTVRYHGVSETLFNECLQEDVNAELLDGEMMVYCLKRSRADKLANFLRTLLRRYAKAKKAGTVFGSELLVHLADNRKVAPDAYFVRQKPTSLLAGQRWLRIVPDLVVDVLNPAKHERFLDKKHHAYWEARIPEIWSVNLEEKFIVVDRLRKKHYASTIVRAGQLASVVLEGFWVETNWLWTDPLPSLRECLREILGHQ